MRVSDIQVSGSTNTIELSGKVNDFRLWYRFPSSYRVSAGGDAFLAIALLPAMLAGEALEVDRAFPVSQRLLESVGRLQEIYHCWNPVFRKVAVRAEAGSASVGNPGIASFFSGGVDGTFTALKNADITHLVLINGFDFSLEPPVFAEAVDRNRAFAASLGKTLLPLETNFIAFNDTYRVSRNLSHGSLLGSVALALAFSRVYIASSRTYDNLIPWGTHPLTDLLFSSEATEIVHDGAEASRSYKTRKIFECEAVGRNLRVCWQDMNRNCGRCEKCLRTRMALRAMGISAPAFEDLHSLDDLRILRVSDVKEQARFQDNLRLAEARGDRALARVLRRAIRRYDRHRLMVDFDRLLLGGVVKRTFRYFVKPERLRPGPAPDLNYPVEQA